MTLLLMTQIAGWIGTILIVLAYVLVSNKKLTGSSHTYQVLNIVGAVGVGANVAYTHAWPALALQLAWIIIGLEALWQGRRHHP